MSKLDFLTVTACGESCVDCNKKEKGVCEGCIESDGHCNEWQESGACPIHKCAKKHNVLFCGLCNEFPCDWLVNKVVWNPNIVEHLKGLAEIYYKQIKSKEKSSQILYKKKYDSK